MYSKDQKDVGFIASNKFAEWMDRLVNLIWAM